MVLIWWGGKCLETEHDLKSRYTWQKLITVVPSLASSWWVVGLLQNRRAQHLLPATPECSRHRRSKLILASSFFCSFFFLLWLLIEMEKQIFVWKHRFLFHYLTRSSLHSNLQHIIQSRLKAITSSEVQKYSPTFLLKSWSLCNQTKNLFLNMKLWC